MYPKYRISAAIVAILGLVFSGAASASMITAWSGDGGDVLVSSVNPGSITQITPHSVWGDVSDDAGLASGTAKWISYANTGSGGSIAPDTTDRNDISEATAHFQRTFSGGAGAFNLWILTDDTATVKLNGNLLFDSFDGQLDPCAPGGTGVPIGCAEADMGIYSTTLAAGSYTLDIYAFQTNQSVFGSQYAFSYQSTVVPAPSSLGLLLLGFGLVGIGIYASSKRRYSS